MKALIINCSPVRCGATAKAADIVREAISERFETRCVCIDDYSIGYCRGCRNCHTTARCIQHDDTDRLISEFEQADVIIAVSPSYWADVPGQFKCFIDRCTPWCNTHEPHASLPAGKKGYSIALRTGPGTKECERILDSLEHFFGHLEIQPCGRLGLCSVECFQDVVSRKSEIEEFCRRI